MSFTVHNYPARGLCLSWQAANGLSFTDLPLRVRLRGANTFCVWGNVDSGEGLPAWAEPELNLELFGGDSPSEVETISAGDRVAGYRATARNSRVEALLEIRDQDGELAVSLQLRNPQHAGGKRLPLCLAELAIGGLDLGAAAEFASAHSYGGRTHGVGRLAELVEPGMPFAHGCIGLSLPLLVLHDPTTQRGLQLEFMMDGRPTLWLRPGVEKPTATCAVYWSPDRLLQPGQVHAFGGGPKELGEPPQRLPPERAREYLLLRYASLLPGAISEDGVEGYCSEEARPWTVVSMLAGPTTFKTHAEYVNDPLTFRQLGDAPPAGPLARDLEQRRRGHEEFLQLLRLRADEPLIGADTPLSIDGVQVDGDAAVVGLLRPSAARCLLILINFADRPATVRVRLAEPVDIPLVQRALAGAPHTVTWQARERLRSIAETESLPGAGTVSGAASTPLTLGAYGFRVLDLIRG